jgi:hypothetical protein
MMPITRGEGIMRSDLLGLFVAFLTTASLVAQTPVPARATEAAVVAFAQAAAIRALNFEEGDIAGLRRAQPDFTAEGWKSFMKHMEGFLTPMGVPIFSSSFVPSGSAVVTGRENGIVHLRIPGTLKQTQKGSSTTYRANIEVRAGGDPTKIEQLDQTTCGRPSIACP